MTGFISLAILAATTATAEIFHFDPHGDAVMLFDGLSTIGLFVSVGALVLTRCATSPVVQGGEDVNSLYGLANPWVEPGYCETEEGGRDE